MTYPALQLSAARRMYGPAFADRYDHQNGIYLPLKENALKTFPLTPLLDDFNRANESPAVGWTAMNVQGSTSNIKVASNVADAVTAGVWSGARFDRTGSLMGDSEAWITVGATTSNSGLLFIRRSTDANPTGYHIEIKTTGGGNIDLWRSNGESSWTKLDSKAFPVATGGSFGLRAIGSRIQVWAKPSGASTWFQIGGAIDTTYRTGSIGIGMFPTFLLDSFGGGALTPNRPAVLAQAINRGAI